MPLPSAPHAVTIPPLRDAGKDTPARRAARARLAAVLWDAAGDRRLPRDRALRTALRACDPRDVWWVCEANSAGPVYLLPTVEWVQELARLVVKLRARTVVEVGAGDGFLSHALAASLPRVRVVATDTGAWARPASRMNAADKKRAGKTPFAGIRAGSHVEKRTAANAIAHHQPDLVIVSWAPPGTLVERAIRAPAAQHVLDLSVDGDVCGNGARTWRFEKEFLEGPIATRALCRLDGGAFKEAATRATLYYGRAHPLFAVERRIW